MTVIFSSKKTSICESNNFSCRIITVKILENWKFLNSKWSCRVIEVISKNKFLKNDILTFFSCLKAYFAYECMHKKLTWTYKIRTYMRKNSTEIFRILIQKMLRNLINNIETQFEWFFKSSLSLSKTYLRSKLSSRRVYCAQKSAFTAFECSRSNSSIKFVESIFSIDFQNLMIFVHKIRKCK